MRVGGGVAVLAFPGAHVHVAAVNGDDVGETQEDSRDFDVVVLGVDHSGDAADDGVEGEEGVDSSQVAHLVVDEDSYLVGYY